MNKYFLKPGFIFYTPEPCIIMAVVGASFSISLWHPRLKIGGMNHFISPLTKGVQAKPSALFMQPATIKLVRMFQESGVETGELEANLFGGAFREDTVPEWIEHGKVNIHLTEQLLGRYHIRIVGMDVGGNRGRKILFNTGTGEAIVARVNNLREDDWYPSIKM